MSMRTSGRFPVIAALAALFVSALLLSSRSISGQALPRLFDGSFLPRAEQSPGPKLTVRGRRTRAQLGALDAPALSMNLFDDTEITVTRTQTERPRADRLIWHGRGDD